MTCSDRCRWRERADKLVLDTRGIWPDQPAPDRRATRSASRVDACPSGAVQGVAATGAAPYLPCLLD